MFSIFSFYLLLTSNHTTLFSSRIGLGLETPAYSRPDAGKNSLQRFINHSVLYPRNTKEPAPVLQLLLRDWFPVLMLTGCLRSTIRNTSFNRAFVRHASMRVRRVALFFRFRSVDRTRFSRCHKSASVMSYNSIQWFHSVARGAPVAIFSQARLSPGEAEFTCPPTPPRRCYYIPAYAIVRTRIYVPVYMHLYIFFDTILYIIEFRMSICLCIYTLYTLHDLHIIACLMINNAVTISIGSTAWYSW